MRCGSIGAHERGSVGFTGADAAMRANVPEMVKSRAAARFTRRRPLDIALPGMFVASSLFGPRSGCSMETWMETRIDEIADGIYRLSTFVPQVAPPAGFTFNQFLVTADEPFLFHCGARGMFPLVSAAVARVMPVERLRWISFGHVESDECGAMNLWLAAAPQAQIVFNRLGCDVSLNDLADRPPRAVEDGEVLDLGGKRIRFLQTPHVPHGWEAQAAFEETGRTLFCGDLFTHVGRDGPVTDKDIVEAAMAAEDMFGATALGPQTAPTLRRLADLEPAMLALMHGASFRGDGAAALRALADRYEARLQRAA
jgi:flavorubredoxin